MILMVLPLCFAFGFKRLVKLLLAYVLEDSVCVSWSMIFSIIIVKSVRK